MRSKSCGAGNRPGGFSLLELILVLAIAGMLAGVVVVGLGRGSSVRDQRLAITDLASELQLARIAAMQSGEAVVASIEVSESGISCSYAEVEKAFPCTGLAVSRIDSEPSPEGDAWSVRFEADGRTRRRVIAFAGAGGSDTLLPHIEFDPISGAIELGRAMDPSPRDQGGADR